jgi:Sel1 repeat-containing protein
VSFERLIVLAAALVSAGCLPGTYYDPVDPYVRGVRFFDRGDYATARQIWEPLVTAGDCDAEFRLGLIYFLALGVNRDVPKALGLWTSAANRGQPRAQYALGDVYFHSEVDTQFFCRFGCENVAQDLVTAYKWYLLAEKSAAYDNDKRYVAEVLPRIRARLSEPQRTEGEHEAAGWRPHPEACKPRRLL